jgi:hypothetical protein
MTNRFIALILCSAIAAPGCATTGATGTPPAGAPDQSLAHRAVLAEYVQKLPLGSAIRVDRVRGRTLRGTLMKATAEVIVVQPRTRLPEPPVEIAIGDVLSVTPDTNGTNIGKAIGIGAAAGAGAALGVLLILIAIYSD